MREVRVLVCGGRDYVDKSRVFAVLDATHDLLGVTLIIQGGARGADRLARAWAEWRGVPCDEYEADWDRHGKRAGFLRNRDMLVEGQPDFVIAFPGGRGTADMVRQSRAAGVNVTALT